jgi:hypothetical protein
MNNLSTQKIINKKVEKISINLLTINKTVDIIRLSIKQLTHSKTRNTRQEGGQQGGGNEQCTTKRIPRDDRKADRRNAGRRGKRTESGRDRPGEQDQRTIKGRAPTKAALPKAPGAAQSL